MTLKAALTGLTLLLSGVAGATAMPIANASFEDGLNGWTHAAVGRFGRDTVTGLHGLPTDGQRSGRIYSLVNSGFSVGQYGSIGQAIDLTGIDSLIFDAALDSAQGRMLHQFSPILEAALLIDGITLWRTSQWGGHFNQSVDTSGLSGVHTVEFRNQVVRNGSSGPSNWFMFDNLRATPGPHDIRTASVPVPAPLVLIGFGLVALWRLRRQ